MKFQAHRGVSTEAPENTFYSIELAVEQGYDVIEVDVDVTKDGRFVLMHDHSIGRTARNHDGSKLENAPDISDLNYDELANYDFGLWFSLKYKGAAAPLLSDVLDYARANGVLVKIDNKYRFYTPEQRKSFYALLARYQDVAQLTCFTLDDLKEAIEYLPEMEIHYDGAISDEILEEIASLLPRERVTVWIPIENKLTWWVKVEYANRALADKINKYAKLGAWIISSYEDADFARSLGADIVETNGMIKPDCKKNIRADMHTHSEFSHDSTSKIEDMMEAGAKKGINVMAVTDHFDTESYDDYDVHTPIKNAHEEIERLRATYSDGVELLKGVEIGEGFWFPNEDAKIHTLDYDVIIGSVHLVKYKELTYAYSRIDFSQLSEQVVGEYFDAYLDDMLTMLDTVDFDILAHLTCPTRYIKDKYDRQLDLKTYEEKITKILEKVIRSGRALEINTLSYPTAEKLASDEWIFRKYYDMGGYMITLGSDAHTPERVGADFDMALGFIRKIGFTHLYYFKNRRPIAYEI